MLNEIMDRFPHVPEVNKPFPVKSQDMCDVP
jgi:hypothetical protein